jgi:hypothetical protein
VLGGAAAEAFEAMRMLRAAAPGTYRPAAGVTYPRSPFGQALQEIARLAKADVGLEIAFAESTNWDHHVNEGNVTGQVATRLADLSSGLAALAADLGERLADTIILTMSEFGRAVAENGNGGTDHGHGNAMLLLGGPVKGRHVYGRWPGLKANERFEGRDPRRHDRLPRRLHRHRLAAPRRVSSDSCARLPWIHALTCRGSRALLINSQLPRRQLPSELGVEALGVGSCKIQVNGPPEVEPG